MESEGCDTTGALHPIVKVILLRCEEVAIPAACVSPEKQCISEEHMNESPSQDVTLCGLK